MDEQKMDSASDVRVKNTLSHRQIYCEIKFMRRKIDLSVLLYNAIQTIHASLNSYVESNDLYTNTTESVREGCQLRFTLFQYLHHCLVS